jgi:predicted RNase H-like nuclease (RuvC/YqgF family)
MDNNLENSKETSTQETNSEQNAGTKDLEARIKALEAENGKLKQSVTNASADASDWKKKYQSKLSEEEKAKQEQESAYAAMQEKLTALEAERNIANYTAVLGASDIGMDADTARTVAEALNAGETEKVFDGIRKFIASHDKAMAEKAMLNNPKLPGGDSTKTVTLEQFRNMGLDEMQAFHDEHPDLYREYMNKT